MKLSEKEGEEALLEKERVKQLKFEEEGYERAKNIFKSEYGKTSEIVNAYINNIMGLPTIMGENPRGVEEFYKRFLYNVQSLETLANCVMLQAMFGLC